ncbi:MAG: flagellar biosynthesis repressor FlbT [Smithellaceae bacterium]|nr:flagellar biosynthesis repressor FlbT [Smithellaceae bacterium]
MALRIELKPHEKFIIGGAVIRNGGSRCELLIENNVPIMREKNILKPVEADTPCKRIYFVIQLMYIEPGEMATHHKIYWELVRDVLKAAPSLTPLIDQISEEIISNRHYQALKLARELIRSEEMLVNYVRNANGGLSAESGGGVDGSGS